MESIRTHSEEAWLGKPTRWGEIIFRDAGCLSRWIFLTVLQLWELEQRWGTDREVLPGEPARCLKGGKNVQPACQPGDRLIKIFLPAILMFRKAKQCT